MKLKISNMVFISLNMFTTNSLVHILIYRRFLPKLI
nr:MAG TPA: hypothetical protein [Caudoviricetes sp.]